MTEIWEYKTSPLNKIENKTEQLSRTMNTIAKDRWENYLVAFDSEGEITRLFWRRKLIR